MQCSCYCLYLRGYNNCTQHFGFWLRFKLSQTSSDKNDIKANFEKAYWRLDPSLDENRKELATATLGSIALNYMQRKGPTPPKTLLRAISRLRKQQDIVISKTDKGNGVIILDKSQYVELLKKSSVNLIDKFAPESLERPKIRGRPPKQYDIKTAYGLPIHVGQFPLSWLLSNIFPFPRLLVPVCMEFIDLTDLRVTFRFKYSVHGLAKVAASYGIVLGYTQVLLNVRNLPWADASRPLAYES